MNPALYEFWAHDQWRAVIFLGLAVLLALVVLVGARPLLRRLASATANRLDDAISQAVPLPLAMSVFIVGAREALRALQWESRTYDIVDAIGTTLVVILWTRAISYFSRAVIERVSDTTGQPSLVQPRTVPLFDILARTLIYGGAVYFLLLTWNIDVSAWLASAGVVGIAIGFASKDTLSNLVAGLFIIADSPYKLGDYLLIDGQTRGKVTHIGLRSTRLLTRDEIEVIVPNSVMAGARITNESGGPRQWHRVRCAVSVGYDSDLDRVREVLTAVCQDSPWLRKDDPERLPRVRFREFQESGIKVEVLGWIEQPEQRGVAVDSLVVEIWRAFRKEGIEIPYPQHVVHLSHPR